MDRNESPAATIPRGSGEVTTLERNRFRGRPRQSRVVALAAVVFRMAPTHGLDARPV